MTYNEGYWTCEAQRQPDGAWTVRLHHDGRELARYTEPLTAKLEALVFAEGWNARERFTA